LVVEYPAIFRILIYSSSLPLVIILCPVNWPHDWRKVTFEPPRLLAWGFGVRGHPACQKTALS
jgi:hypothetical protein